MNSGEHSSPVVCKRQRHLSRWNGRRGSIPASPENWCFLSGTLATALRLITRKCNSRSTNACCSFMDDNPHRLRSEWIGCGIVVVITDVSASHYGDGRESRVL